MNFVEPIRDTEKIRTMKRLLTCQRDRLLFVLGINTALRVSDLLRLTVGDVTDSSGRPLVSISLREKKTGKKKTFPLNASIKKELKAWLEERGHAKTGRSEPLFLSKRGSGTVDRQRA
jgi:integrase